MIYTKAERLTMTLYDVYVCTQCGFINNSSRKFTRRGNDLVCPDCGCDDQDFLQGPSHDSTYNDFKEVPYDKTSFNLDDFE